MTHTLINNTSIREDWLYQLADAITDPYDLLRHLQIKYHPLLDNDIKAKKLFPFRVPKPFVSRMIPGNPNDPLLNQVMTTRKEFKHTPGFIMDPLNEKHNIIVPGLLHKYYNRVLILVKNSCAINCRYCFRRYFPYPANQGNKNNWLKSIEYIHRHTEINEVILSGGDPLMAKDSDLEKLINSLEKISHLTTLRIHSRLPIVIPSRVTSHLCQILAKCRFKVVFVTHINHAHEIDKYLCKSIAELRNINVILLNQSVLLRNVNDDENTLAELSETLFSIGILPYYLHLLDHVQGTAHFMVDDEQARKIMRKLLKKVSGYLVPRLVREVSGKQSKIPLDLRLT